MIYAFDYDIETGNVSNKRDFINIPKTEGIPDGMTVDASGDIWSAMWYGSCIMHYDDKGNIIEKIVTGEPQTSSLVFGGKDLTDVLVTSSGEWAKHACAPIGYDYDALNRRRRRQSHDVQLRSERTSRVLRKHQVIAAKSHRRCEMDMDAILKSIDDNYEVSPIEDSLTDTVVIITGGTTGIGRGCVHGFMKMGAHVVFCGRNVERGNAVQKEMNDRYPTQECIFKQVDVSKEDEVEALVEFTAKTFGRINTLVNNAGYFPLQRPSDDVSIAEFRKVLDNNLVAYFAGIKFALPYLRATKGSVINIGSVLGQTGGRRLGGLLRDQGRHRDHDTLHRHRRGGPRRADQRGEAGPHQHRHVPQDDQPAGRPAGLHRLFRHAAVAWPRRHLRRDCQRGPVPRVGLGELHHRIEHLRHRRLRDRGRPEAAEPVPGRLVGDD